MTAGKTANLVRWRNGKRKDSRLNKFAYKRVIRKSYRFESCPDYKIGYKRIGIELLQLNKMQVDD